MTTLSSILYLLAPLLAFAASTVFMPRMISLSIQQGWFDEPNERKVHTRLIPRTGGLLLVPALLLGVLSAWLWDGESSFWGLMAGIIVLYIVGIEDDLKGMPARIKLMWQVVAASLLVASGWQVSFQPWLELPMIVEAIATVLFVTAVVNAYNLIDGIDGLASGLAVLSGTVFMVLFFQQGDGMGFALAGAMTGTYAGFLLFNFAPAKIFMGDTGSMCLGFVLAALSMRLMDGGAASGQTWQLWQVVAILSTPLCDVVRVVLDRARRHGKLFRAERNHVHHLVLSHGLSHRAAVGLILALNGVAIFLVFLQPQLQGHFALPVMGLLFLLGIGIFRNMAWFRLWQEQATLRSKSLQLNSDNPFFHSSTTTID